MDALHKFTLVLLAVSLICVNEEHRKNESLKEEHAKYMPYSELRGEESENEA